MRTTSLLLAVTTACVLSVRAGAGQTVLARVSAGEAATPVQGALVHLLDADGLTVASRLSDDSGRALFVGLVAGTYRLRAEMIGMASAETDLFPVDAGVSVPVDVGMESSPIQLDGIEVAAGERCRVRPEEGLAVARVWDEARKALAAAAFTDRAERYRYRTMRYERDLERDTRVVLREERSRQEGYMRTPFESRPAEDLVANGFVQPSEGGTTYYAPDAHALLSDDFLDTHCFRLERGRAEADGLVGLAFEPTARRGVPDIAGTLWLDPGTSELRWLEYRYEHLAHLDPDVWSNDIGGYVEFRRMPEGTWIVPEWWIRMPRVAMQTDVEGRRRQLLQGFRQTGGVLLEVRAGGRTLAGSETGGIEGVVLDSLAASPLSGARVGVVGSNQTVFTDAEGRFRISGLPAGTYRVRIVHPELEAFGHQPEPVVQEVFGGEMAYLEHRMPSVGDVLFEQCRGEERTGDTAIVVGTVREAGTGRPVPGATVRARWIRARMTGVHTPEAELTGWDDLGLEATADERGFYRLCAVPRVRAVAIGAFYGDLASPPDTMRITEPGLGVLRPLEIDVRRR